MNNRLTLRILLVFSMIGGLASAFSYFMMAAFMPHIERLVESQPALLPDQMHVMWERMAAIPRPFYAALGALNLLSLVCCILMWNLRRSGFHTYTIAQLLLLLLPLLFLGKAYLGLGDIMFTALFLLIYYLLMRSQTDPQREE